MPEHYQTPVNSRVNHNPVSFNPRHRTVVFCLLLISETGFSQSRAELDKLVFDPVLLDPQSGQEIAAAPAVRHTVFNTTETQSPFTNNAENSVDAQLSAELDTMFDIEKYEQQLSIIEGEDGPFATELYETLLDLGQQYQQANDHEAAIESFERAEYVSRINHGLFHPEQVASIEGIIESYIAMGDLRNANSKQRYLIYLNEQYYGDNNLNALPSIISLANQNMANYRRTLQMPAQPTIRISSSIGPGTASSRQPTPRQMAFGSLFQAQQNYTRAISTLMENRQYFDPVLLELEYRYLETIFLQAYRRAIIEEPHYYLSERNTRTGSRIRSSNRRNTVAYLRGTYTFERLLIYTRSNPEADPAALVQILMDYGDWNLLFGRTQTAVEKYTQANEVALSRDLPEQEIENIFRPAIQVHLPLVAAKPNSREKFAIGADTTLDYDGHIDIAFTISRYGRASKIDVLDKTQSASKRIERRLVKYLRNSPFRPRLQKDGSVVAERVTLRYYFGSADQDTSS